MSINLPKIIREISMELLDFSGKIQVLRNISYLILTICVDMQAKKKKVLKSMHYEIEIIKPCQFFIISI